MRLVIEAAGPLLRKLTYLEQYAFEGFCIQPPWWPHDIITRHAIALPVQTNVEDWFHVSVISGSSGRNDTRSKVIPGLCSAPQREYNRDFCLLNKSIDPNTPVAPAQNSSRKVTHIAHEKKSMLLSFFDLTSRGLAVVYFLLDLVLKVLTSNQVGDVVIIGLFVAVSFLHVLVALSKLAERSERVGAKLVKNAWNELGQLLVLTVAVDGEGVGGDSGVDCENQFMC